MISVSTVISDTSGNVVIKGTADDYRENAARISRIKTLDGGVHITNAGTSDGDRSLIVRSRISQSQEDLLWYIFNSYTFVHVSVRDGFYYAAISDLEIKNGAVRMTILLNNKENA
jgi:hypothetical protein